MSVITQQSWANKDVAFFLRADLSTLNVNSISTGSVLASKGVIGDLSTNTLSSGTAFIHDVEASTIVAQTLQLDAQVLTADSTNLFLNGIPLVTTENISSLQDWALDPAISTLQMNGNNILNASTISCITLVANQGIVATNLNVGNGIFSNLVAFNALFVSTQTSTLSTLIQYTDIEFASTLNANYISSGNVQVSSLSGSSGFFNTLSTGSFLADTVSTGFMAVSTIDATSLLSAPQLLVSSINGQEFNQTGIKVDVAGVSSLTANFVSSLGAEFRTALVSTLQFNPSFNPSLGGVNVNLGLGSILGNVIGWGAGVFGAAAGTVGLATGMTSLALGRQQDYIDNTRYELINGNTQIQISTLGVPFSTIYRFNNSADPERIPGSTIFISTISQPGIAIRSVSDPLNTVSTPNSTIQSFGQWVAIPPELVNTSSFSQLLTSSLVASTVTTGLVLPQNTTIDIRQASGTEINMFSGQIDIQAPLVSMTSGDNAVGIVVDGIQSTVTLSAASSIRMFPALNVPGLVDIQGRLDVSEAVNASQQSWLSTLSTAIIYGANPNVLAPLLLGNEGLKIDAPLIFLSTQQTLITGFTNTSTVGANRFQGPLADISTVNASTLTITGLSSINFNTAPAAGAQTQPAGRLLISGNDVDFGQQDIWCQQIRLGAGNATNTQTEIIFYDANGNQRGLQTALLDRTIRVVSTINANQGGYLLDTGINPPFFSTINNSTALMAFFPSSVNSTIGVSTLSVIPPLLYAGSWYSSTSQTVVGANTETPLTYNSQSVNVGGFTYAGSTITVPVGGLYEITHSIQFDTTSGGTNLAYFWLKKNGATIAQSGSIVSITNNGETLGTISILDQASAGDQYAVSIQSSDGNMRAIAFAASGNIPGIPAIITNVKRL